MKSQANQTFDAWCTLSEKLRRTRVGMVTVPCSNRVFDLIQDPIQGSSSVRPFRVRILR